MVSNEVGLSMLDFLIGEIRRNSDSNIDDYFSDDFNLGRASAFLDLRNYLDTLILLFKEELN